MGFGKAFAKAAEEASKVLKAGEEAAKVAETEAAAAKATRMEEAASKSNIPGRFGPLTPEAKREARDAARGERIGVSQRELSALKEQTIRRSGEKGWQDVTSQFRARLEEGGEFPLRFSTKPSEAGKGKMTSLGRDITGAERTPERVITEHIPRYGSRTGSTSLPEKATPEMIAGQRQAVEARAAAGERTIRAGLSGIPASSDMPVAWSAGVQFGRTGETRGIRGIAQGVASSGDYEKLRKGIQSGAIRAVPAAAAGGYAAQGWGEVAGTYTGPDSSHRNPQVHWGRNRQ